MSVPSLEKQINNLLTLEKEIITLRNYVSKRRYIFGVRDKPSKIAFLNILEDNVRDSIKELQAGNIFRLEKLTREHEILMNTEFPSIFPDKDDGFVLISKYFLLSIGLSAFFSVSFLIALIILL